MANRPDIDHPAAVLPAMRPKCRSARRDARISRISRKLVTPTPLGFSKRVRAVRVEEAPAVGPEFLDHFCEPVGPHGDDLPGPSKPVMCR